MGTTIRLTAIWTLLMAGTAAAEQEPTEPAGPTVAELTQELEELAETMAFQAQLLEAAERRAADAESRAMDAERRLADAESRAMDAERRAIEAETRTIEAERLAIEAAIEAATAAEAAAGPSDEAFAQAIAIATRYRRPDRTSEDNLDDGSHYDQSSDDRSYRQQCTRASGQEILGFRYDIRSNTKSLHWRWKQTTGGAWKAYFNGTDLGPLGTEIFRVADTDTTWYEFEPGRRAERDSEFLILSACEGLGVEELDIHYHH